jgi:hypothetical protein
MPPVARFETSILLPEKFGANFEFSFCAGRVRFTDSAQLIECVLTVRLIVGHDPFAYDRCYPQANALRRVQAAHSTRPPFGSEAAILQRQMQERCAAWTQFRVGPLFN